MRFPYTLSIVPSIDTGEEIVLLRPEIPIRVFGPGGHADVLALVDTGSDNSILPLAVAHDLGIKTTEKMWRHGVPPLQILTPAR